MGGHSAERAWGEHYSAILYTVMYGHTTVFFPVLQGSPTSVEPRASGPTAAPRRHTMAGTKPARPRPPPISPQAHESHEVPHAKRPRPPPPAVTTPPVVTTPTSNDPKSIYATVKKQKRYPAPTTPAPPPPYEGDTVKKLATAESPTTPTPPLAVVEEKKVEQTTKPHPSDETDGGSTTKPRPPRPAPSRPSRPPAGTYMTYN